MFWSKEKEMENGFVVTCWKLIRMNVDVATAKAECTYYGYKSQEDHDAGKDKALEKNALVDFSDLDPQGQLALAVIEKIKVVQDAE